MDGKSWGIRKEPVKDWPLSGCYREWSSRTESLRSPLRVEGEIPHFYINIFPLFCQREKGGNKLWPMDVLNSTKKHPTL